MAVRGLSSIGRAPALQAGGRGFDSPRLHILPGRHRYGCPGCETRDLSVAVLDAVPSIDARCRPWTTVGVDWNPSGEYGGTATRRLEAEFSRPYATCVLLVATKPRVEFHGRRSRGRVASALTVRGCAGGEGRLSDTNLHCRRATGGTGVSHTDRARLRGDFGIACHQTNSVAS